MTSDKRGVEQSDFVMAELLQTIVTFEGVKMCDGICQRNE